MSQEQPQQQQQQQEEEAAPLPPPPPAGVTPTLFNQLRREKEASIKEARRSFLAFLMCTQRGDSDNAAAALLQGHTNLLRRIWETIKPNKFFLLDERECEYKVKLDLCGGGTEHVFVEALDGQSGWEDTNLPPDGGPDSFYDAHGWRGSLSSITRAGVYYRLTTNEPWLGEAAYLKNPDGSYYTEAQLRQFLREEAEQFCCERRCRGRCLALPGDTIRWVFVSPYRQAVGWEPATDAELVERGWDHQGGLLFRKCELFREEAAQRGFRFDVGDRVICRIGQKQLATGRIIQLLYREYDWPDEQFAPYKINLDKDGRNIWAPEDTDDVIMRGLRFDAGTQVLCRTGEHEWVPGTVVEPLYRESDWPEGDYADYQIKTVDGDYIFARKDDDETIKLKNPVPE